MPSQFFRKHPTAMMRPEFVKRFGGVYEHSPWVAEKAYERGLDASLDEVETLHQRMAEILLSASQEAQLALINAHPDLAGKAAVRGELTASSTAEQSGAGIHECSAEEFARFTALNDAYKARFGLPFIKAVKGRNRHQILAAFEQRIHNTPEQEFATALAEINQTLAELDNQYGDDPALQVRARLMQASSLHKSGDPARAAQLAAQAVAQLDSLGEFLSAEAALAVAGQLQQLGQAEAGAAMLKSCVEIYGDDAKVMDGIARLTDDPAILSGGKEAVELNRQGVRAYQLGRASDALELFRRALALQPKNISIALNTAQSLLRLGGDAPSAELLAECRACLDAVRMIPASDPRHERYQQLRRKAFGT